MQVEQMIEELGKELELENPIPQEAEGVWVLYMDVDTPVTISKLEDGFAFQATVCSLPEKSDEEAFLTKCLVGNLFGQGTAGAVLGLDARGEKLVLTREFHELDYYVFSEGIEDFFNAIDFWRAETEEAAGQYK
ncbi:hypothetical protein SCG7086_AN_00160 [Chlamydiales bacterium SCGC AG-110-P3]|nr:hypothetical protein SCG7086_AN_00160 [Chlamydiales bacterium SCGC AG-110-P3]